MNEALQKQPEHPFYIEDYEDEAYFKLLCRLPKELAPIHIKRIEDEAMEDIDAVRYLERVLEARQEIHTETVISDNTFSNLIEANSDDILRQIETDIFTREDNNLGAGYTAKVKRMDVGDGDTSLPVAVKYLVSPTEKTLSASGEHDMVHEVELIKEVVEMERTAKFNYISVPHPYFHHQNESIQCYGMQLINGPDLEKPYLSEEPGALLSDEVADIMSNIDDNELSKEIEDFFQRMHGYCLHGDIKPKNIMFDASGKFYLIDFGQAVLKRDINDRGMGQYENLAEAEVKNFKQIVNSIIRKARAYVAERDS
jgi:tRNA A-37 threonylcarbamoyl transferase component Bud32